MNAGVSAIVGRTSDGTVTIRLSIRNFRVRSMVPRGRADQVLRLRVVLREDRQHLGRGPLRIDLPRGGDERGLVALQVRLADGEQLVEWDVEHLLGFEFLHEGVRADGVLALRLRQQVGFEPPRGGLEHFDHGLVGRLELGEELLVLAGGGPGPRGQVGAEEADRTLRDDDAQVGELLRRVVHVRPHRRQDRRRGLEPADHRFQAVGGRGERPLHQQVDALGRLAQVDHRVPLPVADGFDLQQFGADRVVECFRVDGFGFGEFPGAEHL